MQAAQRLDLALVVEQPVQLGGHQRGEERDVAVVRQPGQRGGEGALDHDRLVARRPASGRRPARPRRTTPAAPGATGHRPPSRRADACTEARTARRASIDPLGRAGRPRRLDHERRGLGHHRQPVPQRGDHLGGLTPHRTQRIHETHASPAGRMGGNDLPATRSAGVLGHSGPMAPPLPRSTLTPAGGGASCPRRRWPGASASSRSCSPSARAPSSPAARCSSPRSSGCPPPRWASA